MTSSAQIGVVVSGAAGKMGQEVVKTVLADPQLSLIAAVDVNHVGEDAATMVGLETPCGVLVSSDLPAALRASVNGMSPSVCVDFTRPATAMSNALAIIEAGVHPVLGTTGFSPDDIQQVDAALNAKSIGGMIVPNFAIGAVLLMQFAEQAAKYMDHAEIIELHHNQKADAPSGTAVKTAEKMQAGLASSGKSVFGSTNSTETETIAGARGANHPGDIRIHSVRLPGLVAHQEVLFGGQGQMLTIRHDSIDRTSFMPGVALACKRVASLTGLAYGLEHVL